MLTVEELRAVYDYLNHRAGIGQDIVAINLRSIVEQALIKVAPDSRTQWAEEAQWMERY